MSEVIVDNAKPCEKRLSGDVRPKSAYITAPSSVDTGPIRKALEAKGVRSFSPDQLDLPALNLSHTLREAMQRADIVLAVVDPTAASNFIFFEVGLAQGMNKPAIVLLASDASPSIWVSSGVPYFRYDPDNPAGLEFGISQILAIPHHGTKTPLVPAKRTHPLGDQVDELLAQLRVQSDNLTERDLTAIVSQAIQASGVTTVAQGRTEPKHVDIAVWSDDLSPWVGNPLAIELRRNLRGTADVNAAVGRLAQGMVRASMLWGLLLYFRSPIDVATVVAVPNILSISVEQFLEALRNKGFGDLVRQLRNQRVHGVC